MKIESGASFAESDFRDDARLVPVWRIDTQHLCAKACEKPACYRPGQNARQVQDAQPLQRASRAAGPIWSCNRIQHGEMSQWLRCNGPTLGMLLPLSQRTHFRGAPARLHHGLLEISLRPLSHYARNGCSVAGYAQNALHRCTMGGGIGVKSDPTITGWVVSSDRVPGWRKPPDGPQRSRKPHGAHSPVDNNGGTRAMRRAEKFRDRQCRRCYRRACNIGDCKRSTEPTGVSENHLIGGAGFPAKCRPTELRQCGRKACHFCAGGTQAKLPAELVGPPV